MGPVLCVLWNIFVYQFFFHHISLDALFYIESVFIFFLQKVLFSFELYNFNLSFNQLSDNFCFLHKFFTKTVSPSFSLTLTFLLYLLYFSFSPSFLSFLCNSVSCDCSGIYSGMLFLILLPKNTVVGNCPFVAYGVVI